MGGGLISWRRDIEGRIIRMSHLLFVLNTLHCTFMAIKQKFCREL
jgi:hypothetical protein